MKCLPSHTQVGVQEGNSFLALDIHQACLDRTGQICLISLPPLLLDIYCAKSMSSIKQKKKEMFFLDTCFYNI